MTRYLTALAFACYTMNGVSAAAELAPTAGHTVRLGHIGGTVYYTIERDGYRVVATLASGAEGLPVRFSSTLAPGQRIIISVPQSVGEPSLDFEILRNGDMLLVSDPNPTATAEPDEAAALNR